MRERLRMFCLLWAVAVLFNQRVLPSAFCSCALTAHVMVYSKSMAYSKSILIVDSCYCVRFEGSVGGLGLVVMMW